jgi:hypothetical protein
MVKEMEPFLEAARPGDIPPSPDGKKRVVGLQQASERENYVTTRGQYKGSRICGGGNVESNVERRRCRNKVAKWGKRG